MGERDRALAGVEQQVRKRTEELRRALKKLDRAKEIAEEADADKAIFISFLAHELRNPLHAIVNLAEGLVDGEGKYAGAGVEGKLGAGGGGEVSVEYHQTDSSAQAIHLSSTYMLR